MICPPRPLIPDMSTFEKVRWPHLATWCYIAAPPAPLCYIVTRALPIKLVALHGEQPARYTEVHCGTFQVRASQIHKRLL